MRQHCTPTLCWTRHSPPRPPSLVPAQHSPREDRAPSRPVCHLPDTSRCACGRLARNLVSPLGIVSSVAVCQLCLLRENAGRASYVEELRTQHPGSAWRFCPRGPACLIHRRTRSPQVSILTPACSVHLFCHLNSFCPRAVQPRASVLLFSSFFLFSISW